MSNIKDTILNNRYFKWLQIPSNWLMQGIFHADMSEKIYKIAFTLFFTGLFYFLLGLYAPLSFIANLLIAFGIAHTLNWFINCNFYVLFVHRMKIARTSKKELFNQLSDIQNRLERIEDKSWIRYSVSHGGICKGTLNEHSDIDVSLIRKPGFVNLIKAILFYVKEKKYADLKKVPLDIFICDTPENCMIRAKRQKNPIVLLDHENEVDNYYTEKLSITIEEAKTLNKYIE